MGNVWVSASTSESWCRFSDSLRFKTSDILPGWHHMSFLCCRCLLCIWLILACLNVALLCLPVTFTVVCFLYSRCHLEFKSRSWAAIHYNPHSYSIGRHVFFSRNLSGLSGGAMILLTLVTTDVVYFNALCWHIQIAAYRRTFENVSTASFSARVGFATSEL